MKTLNKAAQAGMAAALLLGAPAMAQTEPAAAPAPPQAPPQAQRSTMADKLINSPFVQNWNTWA